MKENLRILLVDDEILTIKALRVIIEEECRDSVVIGEATNGFEAVDNVASHDPDIAIIDIRMPEMDGIALMQRLHEMRSECMIIVLSAYRDFEYVQTAMKYGAFGYLLKPVDRRNLVKVINEAGGIIAEKRRVREIVGNYSESVHLAREKLLKDIAEGKKKYSEISNKDILGLKKICSYRLIIIRQQVIIETEHIQKDGGKPLLTVFLKEVLLERLNCIIFTSSFQDIAFIVDITAEGPVLNRINNNMDSTLEVILRGISEYNYLPVIIGISGEHKALDDLHLAFREAESALELAFYAGTGSVVRYDTMKGSGVSKGSEIYLNIFELIDLLFTGYMEKVQDALNLFFFECSNVRYDLHTLYMICFNLVKGIISRYKALAGAASIPQYLRDITIESIKLSISLYELQKYLNGIVKEISASVEDFLSRNEESRIITRVKKHCEENYNNDIALDTVAGIACMTRNYFCSFFKKHTGEHFTDYLTDLRINKAKAILGSTETKINKVSEMTGFKSSTHFCRVFKETVGISPVEYRRIHFVDKEM